MTPRGPAAAGDRALDAAVAAALAAGQMALRRMSRPHRVALKADRTPVSDADRDGEEIIRGALARAFPGDAILGEEYGGPKANGAPRWIVDPIDGTRNYVRGIPYWGTLIAREEHGRTVLGVMYLPALGQLAWAARGRGAWINRRRLTVVPTAALAAAHVVHGYLSDFARAGALPRLAAVARRATVVGSPGDCSPFLWVAAGRATAMIEARVAEWDVAAPRLLVEEAGGVCSVWRRDAAGPHLGLLASCPRMHGPLLRLLKA